MVCKGFGELWQFYFIEALIPHFIHILFFVINDDLDRLGVGLEGPHQCSPWLLVNKVEPQNLIWVMVVRSYNSVNLVADII
jgi:hypothetical protein